MTCIVGLKHKGQVWLGGDSAGTAGWSQTVRADEKVFAKGDFLFGFSGSFRMGQLLRYSFNPPDHDPRVELNQFMATTFIEAIRDCLKKGGFVRNDQGVERIEGQFVVGYRGELFLTEQDFQVARSADDFLATGCGADLALGAMFAAAKMTPEKRIRIALQAAERFSSGVRSPFVVLSG